MEVYIYVSIFYPFFIHSYIDFFFFYTFLQTFALSIDTLRDQTFLENDVICEYVKVFEFYCYYYYIRAAYNLLITNY